MSIAHLLEDFDAFLPGTPVSMTDLSVEEIRLEAFEKGYQAGWDDAVKAQQEDSRAISADLQQNLQDLSFTYAEARNAVIDSLAPLIRQMVKTVLPDLAKHALPLRVAEQVDDLVRTLGDHRIEIQCAPRDLPAICAVLDTSERANVSTVENNDLPQGQVRIRMGDSEREIDVPETLRSLGHLVDSFLQHEKKDTA